MQIRYIGTFSNRSVFGIVMNTGDVQEFTAKQGAHLLRNTEEFEAVEGEKVKAKPAPKAKRIGKTASKKKK